MNLRLHGDAEQEVIDGADYYGAISPRLRTAFIVELESALETILQYPSAGCCAESSDRTLGIQPRRCPAGCETMDTRENTRRTVSLPLIDRSALRTWVEAVNAHGGLGIWPTDVVLGEVAGARDMVDRHA